MDKNRSTAIAPIFEFVIEFSQSILLHYRVFVIDFFCNQVFFALEFLQSVFCNRVFAIEFLQSSFCNRVFAIKFLQSCFCNRVFYNPVFAVILHHYRAPLFIQSCLTPVVSRFLCLYMESCKVKKMASAGPTELQLELDEFLGEPEGCLVILSIQITACYCMFLWMECYSMQAEWLLSDVLFIAEELPGPMQPDGEILTQEQLALLCLILNNHHFQVADIVRL